MQQSMILKALGLTAMSTMVLSACDRDEKIDENTASQTISSNLTATSNTMVETVRPFKDVDAFGVQGEEVFGAGQECYGEYDSTTGEYTDVCETVEPIDIDAEMSAVRDAALDYLKTNIFIADHIEEQKNREITYLLKGSNLCKELRDEAADYKECTDVVDGAQIRLVVTSPEEGDLDIDVFFGKEKNYNPVSFNIWQDRVGLRGDLKSITRSAELVANIVGEDLSDDLPATFEGAFQVELISTGAKSMSLQASVLETIKIADPDEQYDVMIAAASPAMSWTIDGSNKTLSGESSLNALRFQIPEESTHYEPLYDDMGNWLEDKEEVVSFLYTFAMAGSKGKATIDLVNEKVDLSGVSFGGSPVTLDIDGKQVFSMALDKVVGMTVTSPAEDKVQFDVDPAKLTLDFSFDKLSAEQIEDLYLEDWELNEQITIEAAGSSPSFLLDEQLEQFEALSGSLTIKAAQRGIDYTIEGSQCLMDDYIEVAPCPGDGSECPGGDEEHDDHVLAYTKIDMCK